MDIYKTYIIDINHEYNVIKSRKAKSNQDETKIIMIEAINNNICQISRILCLSKTLKTADKVLAINCTAINGNNKTAIFPDALHLSPRKKVNTSSAKKYTGEKKNTDNKLNFNNVFL